MYGVVSKNEFRREFGVPLGWDLYQYFSNEVCLEREEKDLPPGMNVGFIESLRMMVAERNMNFACLLP